MHLQLLAGPSPPAAPFSPPNSDTRHALRCAPPGGATASGTFTSTISAEAAHRGGHAASPLRWRGPSRFGRHTFAFGAAPASLTASLLVSFGQGSSGARPCTQRGVRARLAGCFCCVDEGRGASDALPLDSALPSAAAAG